MDIKDIQNRIGELRSLKSISSRKMSIDLGLAHSYINQIENGVKVPSLETLLKILDYLEITLADFFAEETPELSPQLRRLLNTARELTPEQLAAVQALLDTMKGDSPNER